MKGIPRVIQWDNDAIQGAQCWSTIRVQETPAIHPMYHECMTPLQRVGSQ